MNLVQLASHTVDLDLLPEAPRVLDAGCRDFDFTAAVLEHRPRSYVYALDPGPDLCPPPPLMQRYPDALIHFSNRALVGSPRFKARLFTGSTGHGDFLSELQSYYDMIPIEVHCVTLSELGGPNPFDFWDLVKLDIEGSEFEVLERWPGPIARQISVEFHDWNQPHTCYSETYWRELFTHLGKFGYRVVQHELSRQGNGVGHWDSLIVLDDAKWTSGG